MSEPTIDPAMLPKRLDLRSMRIADERIARLRETFPEVFREGQIDFDALKRSLSEWVEPGKERFGLNWPGKAECMRVIQAPSVGTLLPMRDESVDFDTTQNLIIEGDNLEVLKLLQNSYYGKVKMIYIDPPYNTGNEFIYPDNFREGLEGYLRFSGQVDDEGRRLSTSTESSGRVHSKWLSMLYPRLFLARNLLSDDGVVFVSINDIEVHHLRSLLNEVFGEETFIGALIWKSRHNVDSRNKTGLSSDHEYVLAYGRSLTGQRIDETKYSNPDGDERGPWMSDNMVGLATREQRPNLHYDLTNPQTGITYPCPEKGWRYDRNTMARKIAESRVLWPNAPDGRPRHKKFLAEVRSKFTGFSSLLDVPNTSAGTQEVRTLLGAAVFDFPKPTGLLTELIRQGTDCDGDIVLDFFAGSGTTAHATMLANLADGQLRRFVLVQLPEPLEGDYSSIAALCRERVRRAGRAISSEAAGNLHGQNGTPDCGFRAYKLSMSNFRPWDGTPAASASVENTLYQFADNVLDGRDAEDILAEILLKSSYELTADTRRMTLAGKDVFSIAGGDMLICLDRELTLEVFEAMVERKPAQIICLDAGFRKNDQLKVNAVQTIKSRARSEESTIVFKVV